MEKRIRFEIWVDGERMWQRTVKPGEYGRAITMMRGRQEEAVEHAAHVVEVREIIEVCEVAPGNE